MDSVIWSMPILPYCIEISSLLHFYYSGKGTPIRHVIGKSKIILGLLEGIPTMLKGEVAMVYNFELSFSDCDPSMYI